MMTFTDTTSLSDTYLIAAVAGAALLGAVMALMQALVRRVSADPGG
jgi:hypothetical protein